MPGADPCWSLRKYFNFVLWIAGLAFTVDEAESSPGSSHVVAAGITICLVQGLKWYSPDFPDIGSGILVHEVVPDSPAQKGGLETGDIIVKLNGHPLVNTGELQEAIQEDMPLLLEVRRGNDDLLFNIEPNILMQ